LKPQQRSRQKPHLGKITFFSLLQGLQLQEVAYHNQLEPITSMTGHLNISRRFTTKKRETVNKRKLDTITLPLYTVFQTNA